MSKLSLSWDLPVVAAAALVGAWGITTPSLWRDESVSAMVARMSFGDLFAFLGDLDAVHALYYLVLRPFAAIEAGPVEWWLRAPSWLAFVGAAYGVAVLGRRLAGPVAGLMAGLVYVLLPIASRYGQEARSYALVSLAAVAATWFLVELIEGRRPRRAFAGYFVSVCLLGALHLYALLLLLAHGVAVAAAARTSPKRGRRVVVAWVSACASAAVVLTPLVVIAAGQRETQVWWLKRPGLAEIGAFPVEVAGGVAGAVLLGALVAAGIWAARRTPVVGVWAIVPFAAAVAVSQVQPIYHARYVLYVVPGIALAAGIGLAVLARRWSPVAAAGGVTALAVLAAEAQVVQREPGARPDDLRALSATLAAERRPGDRVLFVPHRYRLFTAVYGEPYRNLVDVTREPGSAVPHSGEQVRAALAGARRVWLVSPWIGARYRDDERLVGLRARFEPGPVKAFGDVRLTLYERRAKS
ncbi:hypothetical protein [Nonomuraea sp. NPDC050310]|uniref:glycosyltransferase family 39 protein n=1 Tax=Nonomuraea sp. NPDC050310 TaxID=3154935 RepID=UPI0033C08CD5